MEQCQGETGRGISGVSALRVPASVSSLETSQNKRSGEKKEMKKKKRTKKRRPAHEFIQQRVPIRNGLSRIRHARRLVLSR